MKGLMRKDLYAIKAYGLILPVLLVFFLVIGLTQGNVVYLQSMLSSALALLSIILVINSLSIDQASKWDVYALSLPIRRKDVIRAKYLLYALLLLGCALLCALLCFAAGLFMPGTENPAEVILLFGAVVLACLLLISLFIPLIYKFGVEKARFLLMAVALLPTLLIFASNALHLQMPDFGSLSALSFLKWLAPLVVFALVLLSYKITVRIYEHKDF